MHENNSSPTTDQRMPRIVDQIDGRALDTIVLPSNIEANKLNGLDSIQKQILSQREADKNNKNPTSAAGRANSHRDEDGNPLD